MANTFETVIQLHGYQLSNTPPFIRLTNKGLPANFVEFFSQAQAPGSVISANGQQANCIVDFTKFEIHFSDDPIPVPPPTGHAGPFPPIKPPFSVETRKHPPQAGYFGNDGTPLTPTPPGAPITGFTGTSKTGAQFSLQLSTGLVQAPGRVQGQKPEWLVGHVLITKTLPVVNGGPNPNPLNTSLTFTIGYCPSNNLALVSLVRGKVGTVIDIDLSQIAQQPDGSFLGYANLARVLAYHGDVYSSDQAQMPVDSPTTGIYFPAHATQWPAVDSLEYFFDAVASLVGTLGVAPPANTPLINFASVGFGPPKTLNDFLNNAFTVLTPAIGTLAARFISPNEPDMDMLSQLAYWLGWHLTEGSGKPWLNKMLTDLYNADVALVKSGKAGRSVEGLPGGLPGTDPSVFAQKVLDYFEAWGAKQ